MSGVEVNSGLGFLGFHQLQSLFPWTFLLQGKYVDRLCGEYDWSGSEDPYGYLDPLEESLAKDKWYEEVVDASGLDTSLDTGLVSLPSVAAEERALFAMLVRKAAKILDPTLP
ncbi:hypothetical protein NDU88_006963 [Pleurodeles waltl]|uniref:Uncharacterized protein n=1 Tax=Pleurodeles waltl TaxID=8319 RepID=A0AAV7U1M1_PLEWA|nr:hypothetical protein NDU88_006963 [Pleurodeles waltl]